MFLRLNGLEQFSGTNAKGLCDGKNVFKGNVPFAAFDGTDVRSVKSCSLGQFFLRYSERAESNLLHLPRIFRMERI